ncbi:MAG: methylmalonyl-CoA mutase family protein [Dehalococcoidia bacterium]|nr:methylmalonyl-CoA mutase family protein [Dehalococcoidia bacterium]
MNKRELKEIQIARKQYDELVAETLKKTPEEKSEYCTDSWIPVDRVYSPIDTEGTDYVRDIGFPGEYPYTRGLFPNGFRGRTWNKRQVAGWGTVEETNKLWKYLISQGGTALTCTISGSAGGTMVNWDTDDEILLGYGGGQGVVKTDTVADWETAFDGIDLDKVNIHLPMDQFQALAYLIAAAENMGYSRKTLRGSTQGKVRLLQHPENKGNPYIDMAEFTAREMQNFNTFCVDTRNVRDGGLTAVQEIAFGISAGMEGIREIMKRGLDVDRIAPRAQFYMNSGPDIFEEACKFRAMRRMWARVMKDKFGAKDPRSWRVRVGVQTLGPYMQAQQPFNNIVRGAFCGLGAILGGTQSLSIQTFDEAVATPSEFAQTISIRTAQIIENETGITRVVDPLGGSYYVEWLTNKMEEEAQKIIDKLEELGGVIKRPGAEWFYQQMMASAVRYQREIDNKERIIVGVNEFVMDENEPLAKYVPEVRKYDPTIRERQIARLNKVRRERDKAQVEKHKKILYEVFKSGENMMPHVIDAAKAYVTSGEVQQMLMKARGDQYGPGRPDMVDGALFYY